MGLFARNRRYYLIPIEHKKEKYGDIYDRHKNLIGKINHEYHNEIIVTEINDVVCFRMKKIGFGTKYSIEDGFGNYLGKVGIFKKSGNQEIEVDDRYDKRILFTKGFVEWSFTIRDNQRKRIAEGTTTKMAVLKDRYGIKHARSSFLLSIKPHHPDSRFFLAIFIVLLKKMSRTDIAKYYLKLGPALPL